MQRDCNCLQPNLAVDAGSQQGAYMPTHDACSPAAFRMQCAAGRSTPPGTG